MSPLETLCESNRVTITYRESNKPCPWSTGHDNKAWRARLAYQGRALTVDYWTGNAIVCPTAADVLACLVADAASYVNALGFEDWANDFGYDTDSRKALDTYNACRSMEPRIRRLLGADFDTFANAEH